MSFLFFIPDTEWVVANKDLCERQGYVVRGLPVGEKINFRVVAVNIAGRSPPATMAQPVTIREIMGESLSAVNWLESKAAACSLVPVFLSFFFNICCRSLPNDT